MNPPPNDSVNPEPKRHDRDAKPETGNRSEITDVLDGLHPRQPNASNLRLTGRQNLYGNQLRNALVFKLVLAVIKLENVAVVKHVRLVIFVDAVDLTTASNAVVQSYGFDAILTRIVPGNKGVVRVQVGVDVDR